VFLATGGRLPPGATRGLGRLIGAVSAVSLRRRLRRNLELALGAEGHLDQAIQRYFENFGRLASLQARIYRRGLARTDVSEYGRLGPSVDRLDLAVSQGRGVILASPHLFGHEIAAGLINQRHRVVAIVRESSRPRRQGIKDRWYRALGIATLVRPCPTTPLHLLKDCLGVLKTGAVLGITPDLVVPSGEGVPVSMFGRTAYVRPGLAALAMCSGAPIVTVRCGESADGRREAVFSQPQSIDTDRANAPASVRRQQIMQEWFSSLEAFLRDRPCEWLFWLDKRWTQVIRGERHEQGRAA
jgi:lauroyl/myristoyl acyltransferase